MSVTDQHGTIAEILALEARRCRALAEGDTALLGELVSDDLQHVHADGTLQDRDAYFAHLTRSVERRTERGDLVVRVYGNVAVVTGGITTTIRRAPGEARRRLTGVATQVWTHDGERWRQASFQATAAEPIVELDD